ncbi:MAG TPA: DUF4390 domain-containing protein [Ramlibacter sp.]|uniref:DUF4390 domain-containing protein n=1 Tax=Ramlibacter sp. TaxID=1917967 RepID=UPI002ED564AB
MHRPARILERSVWSCLLVMLVLFWAAPAARSESTPAEVAQMQVERTEEGVLLSATVRFELPHAVDDALAKGIPMYFVAEASIYRDRWYWYDKRVASSARHMRLAYQPLTRRWRLQVSSAPIGQSGLVLGQAFDTREEALAAVQRVSRWRIADATEIDTESPHYIDFRFRLDVSQLPRPFQIGAVGQSDWNILAVRSQRLQLDPPR